MIRTVEAVAALVGTITLVLQRRDRREDKAAVSSAVVQRAVLDLYDRARSWGGLAEDLRENVHDWRRAGCPADTDFGMFETARLKMRAVAAYEDQDRDLRIVLQVYAPEGQDLDRLAQRSGRNLRQLTDRLRKARDLGPAAVDDEIRRFDERTDEVLRSVEELRGLIADRFPLR